MPVINSITSGDQNIPGSYSVDLGSSGMSLTDKYSVGTFNAANPIFPGLFVGRDHLGSNFTVAESLGALTTPDAQDVLGVVAWPVYGAQSAAAAASLDYLDMTGYASGERIQVMQDAPGWIKVFAGEAIDGSKEISVAATTTGSGATLVYAGSLVNADFAAGPVVDLVGLAAINSLYNGATYAKGDLVPLSLQIVNR